VLLPDGYTEPDGTLNQPAELSPDAWRSLADGMSELGRFVRDELGCELVVHSHADTHIASPSQIERLFAETDPEAVRFCLDTGHVVYCGGDPLAIVGAYPDRITYVHLKSVDPAIRRRVADEGLGFGDAVKLGAMVEPPAGEPRMPPLLEALAALGHDLFCIVEQDLYPCPPDVPLPIATRTFAYYAGLGLRTAEGPSRP
jgi:inosose dehydratase